MKLLLSSKSDEAKVAIALLKTVASNILTSPQEDKFRKLLASKVVPRLSAPGASALLSNVGFVASGEHLILPASASLSNLTALKNAIDQHEAVLHARRVEAEARLAEVMRQNQAEAKAIQDKKAAYKGEVLARIQAEKKDATDKPVQSSVANPLSFGCTMKKFEAPCNSGG